MHSKAIPSGLASLWGLETGGARGPRPRYSPAEVAAAGVALADREGLVAVTLAAVARELGLTTTALYRYVDTKEELVELMVDGALGAAPSLPEGWRAAARAWALALRAVHVAHPWVATLPAAAAPRYPAAYDWLAALGAATVDAPAPASTLALVLEGVVRGLAGVPGETTSGSGAPAPWLRAAVTERHPELAATIGGDWADPDAELDRALELVLGADVPPPAPSSGAAHWDILLATDRRQSRGRRG